MNWLDTETKSILQKEHDPKLAPSKAVEFGLVLLRKGVDQERLVRAVRRINESTEAEAAELVHSPVPVTINPGLTEGEALFGQFELICCDAISAFVRSEVLFEQHQHKYLQDVFQRVLESPEFRPTRVKVLDVPATESGQKFLDQFVGLATLGRAKSVWVPFKKARIMKHWAARVGARVDCAALQESKDREDAF